MKIVIESLAISCLLFTYVSAGNLRRTSSPSDVSADFVPSFESKNSNKGPCQSDLLEVCNLSYPTTYQGIFDARMCLWAYREKVSQNCLQYLQHESPSIIEPCYDPISKFCSDVTPGENRIHNCLQENAGADLSAQCLQVVERDFQWRSNASVDRNMSFLYEEDSEDDYYSSNPNDDVDASDSEEKKLAEEAAEFAYLMKKLHHQQMDTENYFANKIDVTSKLSDVVAFQDILSSFSVLPVVQHLHDFLVHINDELSILEDLLMKMLSSADDLLTDEDSTNVDVDFEDSYFYECADCNESNDQVISIVLSDDCNGDDCAGIAKKAFNINMSEVTQEKDAASEEDMVTGDHIFQEYQRASALTTDDEEWHKASSLFSLPTILPLSSEALFNAPKQLMHVMVQTTMSAKSSLTSSLSAQESQSQLRGSLQQDNNHQKEDTHHSPLFLESLRAMIRNALQDPRQ